MRQIISSMLLGVFALTQTMVAQNNYSDHFTEKSLRVDFALLGNKTMQTVGIQQMRMEPLWAGPKKNLIDTLEFGGYFVRLTDAQSGELIYSRGFNTLFEEWRSTDQAAHETQSWSNSISVPYPKHKVKMELLARNKSTMGFDRLMHMEIDPSSIFIDRSNLKSNPVKSIVKNGDSSEKVDLVFVAEGYRASEMKKFRKDAKRFTDALFRTAPFDERKDDFNVWAVELESEESGTDFSGEGVFVNTALNSGFYTFGVDRYLTTPDIVSIRDAVWDVPTDAIFVLVNTERYGGGGMYNFYAIGSADNDRTIEVFVHELGHSFAGLADEYFNSEVATDGFYNLEQEPWEPNITSMVNFESKWRDMLPENMPVPTPLNDQYKEGLGVFEGAGYNAKGLYRPVDHCMMRDLVDFCPVCQRSIHRMIDFLIDDEPAKKGMTGGFSQQRVATADELELLSKAIASSKYADFKFSPRHVSSQVVAGVNYRFICDVTEDGKPSRLAEVLVYSPLPHTGKPASVAKLDWK